MKSPNQVVRLVQLGFDGQALASSTIWLCAGCLTCSSRCPQNFDLAKFMDAMRETALKAGIKIEEKRCCRISQSIFKADKKSREELSNSALYVIINYVPLNLLQDVDVAPGMFMKGKIGLFPHQVKDKEGIKKLFDSHGTIDNKD